MVQIFIISWCKIFYFLFLKKEKSFLGDIYMYIYIVNACNHFWVFGPLEVKISFSWRNKFVYIVVFGSRE